MYFQSCDAYVKKRFKLLGSMKLQTIFFAEGTENMIEREKCVYKGIKLGTLPRNCIFVKSQSGKILNTLQLN